MAGLVSELAGLSNAEAAASGLCPARILLSWFTAPRPATRLVLLSRV
jgi:hypothetical protein